MTKVQSSNRFIILLLFCFLLASIFFVYPNDFRLQSIFTTCDNKNGTVSLSDFTGPITAKPDFRILISVFTTEWTFERRNLLRNVYSLWSEKVTKHIDLRFILCNVTDEVNQMMVSLEIMLHDDIIIMNCTENINFGKTYRFFATLPDLFDQDQPYDYVMKTDDDTYIRLDNLVDSLKDKPRKDLYYGLEIPCSKTGFDFWIPAPFMTGLGYVLSWDLVEWIGSSDIPLNYTSGPEDMMLGWWLQMGELGKNRYDNAPLIYDFRGPDQEADCVRRDLIAETIAVHRIKENSRWVTVLKFFNVTDGLKI